MSKTRRTAHRLASALFASSLLLSGCASAPPASVKPGPFEPLGAGEGFLVVQVDTELGIERLQADRAVIARDLQPGEHLWLIRLPAGRYRWSEVRLTAQWHGTKTIRPETFTARDDREFSFDVEAGAVNYPGEIVIRLRDDDAGIVDGLSLRNRNHSAIAVRTLAKTHAPLLAAHPIRYAGESGDEFLQYYTRMRAESPASREASASNEVGGED